MRKQTKLVAVLSTAALLAVGASMTSFAATGWQEENGTWVYYNKSGDKETEKWEKSGDNWFYLNEDGEMATDVIVEYNDDYYYVDENGAMVTNKWISVENEDYDGDDEDEPVNHWYYFGSNGKAYKSSSNSNTASFKTINGKKYIFDDEGKMLYGWINEDGSRETGDDAWKAGNGVYYCGDENDGAQTIGWRLLEIKDDDYENNGAKQSSRNLFDDEEQERWFWFKNNGKKQTNKDGKTINGKKYSFDEDGRMNAEWVLWDATPTTTKATNTLATDNNAQGANEYTREWRYFGSPEDGARVTKGWFKVVPDEDLHKGKYDDDEDYWYYSDNEGKLVAGEIKTIKGKKYAFDQYGRMKNGLKFYKFENDNPNKDIQDIIDDDDANYAFDTEDKFKENANHWLELGYQCYYFGSGEDGSMKTGKQSITIDGDTFTFNFNKSGSNKGAGKTGVDDDKYYMAGMLLKADKDDKYSVVKIEKKDGKEIYNILDTDEFKEDLEKHEWIKSNETELAKKDKYDEYYDIDYKAAKDAGITYKLVNTSGTVQKSKSKAKDGDDRCYKQDGENIVALFVES